MRTRLAAAVVAALAITGCGDTAEEVGPGSEEGPPPDIESEETDSGGDLELDDGETDGDPAPDAAAGRAGTSGPLAS